MTKVKSVILNDFRIFKGEQPFNFEVNNEIADFVMIYAPNGSGKTSFFDAIEWSLMGKIDRLEHDIKQNDYKGYIIKNRYSNAAFASVKIELDNGDCIHRQTNNRGKDKDYTGGTPKQGQQYISYDKWSNIILPHNKIDSFISARKSTEKYKEWGDFWDPSHNNRDVFEYVYNLSVQAKKEFEYINTQYEELLLDKAEVENSLDDVRAFVDNIYLFNRLVRKKEHISVGKKTIDGKSYSEIIDAIILKRDAAEKRAKEIERNLNVLGACITQYDSVYDLNMKKIAQTENNLSRWKKIIDMCNQKEQQESLLSRKCEQQELLDTKMSSINELLLLGEQWFVKYKNYVNAKELLKVIKSTIDEKTRNKEELDKSKQQKIDSYEALKSSNQLEINKNAILLLVERKKKVDRRQITNNVRHENLIRVGDKNRTRIVELENKQKENNGYYIIKGDTIKHILNAPFGDAISVVQRINILRNDISDESNKKLKLQSMIEVNEKLSSELKDIIDQSRKYIGKTKTSICPVCNTSFQTTDILLQNTYKANGIHIQEKIEELKSIDSNIKSYEEKVQEIITEWNLIVDREVQKINGSIVLENKRKCKIENLLSMLQSRKNQYCDIDERLFKDARKLDYKYDELSENKVDEWYCSKTGYVADRLNSISKEIGEIEKKLNECLESTSKININKNQCEKLVQDFSDDSRNLVCTEFLEKNKMKVDYNAILNTKQDIVNQLSSLKEEIENLNRSIFKNFTNTEMKEHYDYCYENEKKSVMMLSKDIKEYVNNISSIIGCSLFSKRSIKRYIKTSKKKLEKLNKIINILNKISYDSKIKRYFDSISDVKEKIESKKKELAVAESANNRLADSLNGLKEYMEGYVGKFFTSYSINQIYEMIEPHSKMMKLKYEIGFDCNNLPELNIFVTDSTGDDKYLPEWYYSSAQLNVVALSTFLGRALSIDDVPINTIFIDDPIGHFDDVNTIAFVDMLRSIVEKGNKQIILSTHDEVVYNYAKKKITDKYYKSKFIEL